MSKEKESTDDLGPPKVIELKVLKSPIKMAGSCRIHESAIRTIDCNRNQQIAVSAKGKTIYCTLFADGHVPAGWIKLRSTDIKNLGIEENATVTVGAKKAVARVEKAVKSDAKALKKSKKKSKKKAEKMKKSQMK
jgi:hypothetical protein